MRRLTVGVGFGFLLCCLAAGAAPNAREREGLPAAFRPPTRPAVPRVRSGERVRTPIDAFVLSRLERRGLTFAADAPKARLMRRAHLDLTGLPPAPEEVDAYLADTRPGAYERLLDRLLASPRFGERWGRHWLDAAGYADVSGGDNDAGTVKVRDGLWRYRDYVVRAFNEDVPYDRFLTEQLAGDELGGWREAESLAPEVRERLTATGFLRTAPDDTAEAELNVPLQRYEVAHRTLAMVSSSLFGVTLACARCHDHKFEPISQRDYYRMLAAFLPAYNPERWLQPQDRWLPDVSSAEREAIDRHNAAIERDAAELKRRPGGESPMVLAEIAALNRRRRSYGRIQALFEQAPPPASRVHLRGSHETPGEEVGFGFPAALGGGSAAARAPGSSGRRLALARWLARPEHPLTARVFVNRAWQHLFGVGLAPAPDNLGRSGPPPTHPDLLDWLAREFAAPSGAPGEAWRVKRLLRLVMRSTAYRQAAGSPSAADPDNRLLGRQRLRRLEAEAIRDAMLAVSGALDLTAGGPPVLTEARPSGLVTVPEQGPAGAGRFRRSLYLLQRRNYNLSLLAVFDQPVMTANCTRRGAAAVVSQSLFMLNDAAVAEAADRFAAAVAGGTGETGARVELAFRRALCRRPSPREREWSLDLLRRQEERFRSAPGAASPEQAPLRALSELCRMLLNTSEFLYRD